MLAHLCWKTFDIIWEVFLWFAVSCSWAINLILI